jgi:hypothetical protein
MPPTAPHHDGSDVAEPSISAAPHTPCTADERSSSVAAWSRDALVSILLFSYDLDAVHIDSRCAQVHRANFSTEDDMAKKAKKAKKTAKAATKKVAKKTSKKKK